ncbi:hypothetical protein AB205_0177420 [Aquarana catesbeiana]|uniref:Uncharacterized protein n=1 Tax=Aquarana catesbeiana TaxID=8400 RepID=A0A2G9RLE3_AQUCT|nr:hypothetical protein AB205_0177420 [Aquarana catesbeiana]PIO28717.1 hypothetical protein AB205_0177420 [Aquarana catesbeiana]
MEALCITREFTQVSVLIHVQSAGNLSWRNQALCYIREVT